MTKKERFEKHIRRMQIKILNRLAINHPHYGENTHYFFAQLRATRKKLKEL